MAITSADWSRRVEVTGATPASTLTGYVALLTEANLPAEIWTTAINGGGDLRVCLNNDGTSQLPLEVVEFDTVGQTAVLWIRFPTYSSASRNCWLFYGKTGETQPVVTDAFGRNSVWIDFEVSYHFNSSGILVDSTGSNDLTQFGSPVGVTGQIGDGVDGLGLYTNRFEALGYKGVQGSSARTVSVWSKSDALTDKGITTWGNNGSGLRWSVWLQGGQFRTEIQGSFKLSSTSVADGTYKRLSSVYDGTTFPAGLIHRTNGVSDISYTQGSVTTVNTGNGSDVLVGAYSNLISFNPTEEGSDETDEFSIRAFAVSDDLETTEYDNQSSPNTFWSTGTPESTINVLNIDLAVISADALPYSPEVFKELLIDFGLIGATGSVYNPEVIGEELIETIRVSAQTNVYNSELLRGSVLDFSQTFAETNVFVSEILRNVALEVEQTSSTTAVYRMTVGDVQIEVGLLNGLITPVLYDVINNTTYTVLQ